MNFRTKKLSRTSSSLVSGLGLSALLCATPGLAQSPQTPNEPQVASGLPGVQGKAASGVEQSPDPQSQGSIRGTIVDRNGTTVSGAKVTLKRDAQAAIRAMLTVDDGQFFFPNMAPGAFQLTIEAPGFATQSSSGVLGPGESRTIPQITLQLATEVTEVRVELSAIELAQEQMKDEEKQRVLGFIPNFYVSYVPNAAPLTPKQKFELAWKTSVDPITFGITGAVAGVQQAQDNFSGYGQGAQGYGKRYGAAYGDLITSTFIGGALLPSLFKQDPRYFYKGTGSKSSRLLYALANSVICKGDNGHWQANYSAILGSLAAGGISYAYYPPEDRNGVRLTVENTLIGIGATAAANVLQEFVVRKLTPKLPNPDPSNP
jgi:hypothetical protein